MGSPSARYNGVIKHVGELVGGTVGTPKKFNNALLNTVDENSPVSVGMGNSLKIFISYELAAAIGFTKVTVNLFWIQRVLARNANNEPVVPSGERLFRGLDRSSQSNCNDVPFFDVTATPAASGSPRVDELSFNWQVIDLPLVAQPVSPTVLPVETQQGTALYNATSRGIVYETKAKADELFLVCQATPDNDVIGIQNRIVVDVAIGADAQ